MTDDILQKAIALHDRFTHVDHDRRAFMRDMGALAGGSAAAAALAASIAADPAAAAIVEASDPRITVEPVSFPGANGHMLKGVLATPKPAKGKLGSVVVFHENRGLTPYVEDVARRLAVAGYRALAVDLLSPVGGTPADQDKAREMIGALDLPAAVADAAASAAWLKARKGGNGKVGVVGFCWGGAMVNRVAVAAGAAIDGGVAYYGPQPTPAEAAKVKAPLVLHYAGLDERVNAGAAAWVAALTAAGAKVTRYDYPGVNHAFHNDTSGARYDKAAADLSWQRTLAFFAETLK
ncbi:dienelactone hydrolase family protein [Sphingomonas naphthae]|uniref:Dienelactone hydrolase family protein n=1 Tax=Sphingomonas naphthae TaxID=1813468 RepID=A0ABY7TJ07_9SPHN|nr:dienelactone hydrolase family protein [Sphingomonas naphthae]WCT72791.1 dienelactone hydrolase family protein [Sphingomonas naphthae]